MWLRVAWSQYSARPSSHYRGALPRRHGNRVPRNRQRQSVLRIKKPLIDPVQYCAGREIRREQLIPGIAQGIFSLPPVPVLDRLLAFPAAEEPHRHHATPKRQIALAVDLIRNPLRPPSLEQPMPKLVLLFGQKHHIAPRILNRAAEYPGPTVMPGGPAPEAHLGPDATLHPGSQIRRNISALLSVYVGKIAV